MATIKQSAIAYAEMKLNSVGLSLAAMSIQDVSCLDLSINEANYASGENLGALCQLFTIIATPSPMKVRWAAAQRLITSGLARHNNAVNAVDAIAKRNIPELSKYDNLTYSYVTKNVNLTTMVALAATLSSASTVSCALMSRCDHSTWTAFGDDWGFDEDEYREGVAPILTHRLFGTTGKHLTIEEGCALFPNGPFPNGFKFLNQSSSQPVSSTNQGVSSMNATTANTTVESSSLSTLNAAYHPIINGMLSQSGLNTTIEQIIKDVEAKGELERNLAEIEKKSSAVIEDLRKKLATAAATPAMPSTISVVSNSTTIPNGTINMVSADTIFPLMSGLKLTIPQFTWDHAHPDVPAINPNYIFRKEMLVKALRCLAKGENMWLSGHTGSGKTTFIEQVAARIGWPVARIAFDSNVDRSELVGRMSLSGDGNGGTVSSWLPGILERAVTNGYILLCDEMDAGHPNSLYTLQPLLEGKSLTLLEDGGRIVNASLMFRIAATGNTTGNGDPSGLYPACRILSAATLDRFQTFVNVPYMTQEEEVELISSCSPSLTKKLVTSLAKFAGEMRNAFVSNQTPVSYSPRRSIAFAREVEDLFAMGIGDEGTALSMAFKSKLYDAASEEFRQRITEIAAASLGNIDPDVSIK